MATHSVVLAWSIPWTEEPGGLQSMEAQRVRHNWVTEQYAWWLVILNIFSCSYWSSLEKEMATHSSTLTWKIPWTEEPGRLQSMGSQRVGHDWATSLSLSFSNWAILYNKPRGKRHQEGLVRFSWSVNLLKIFQEARICLDVIYNS